MIKQDRRSIAAGHSISNPEAYFFTVDSLTGRELMKAMIGAVDCAQEENKVDELVETGDESAEYEGNRRNVIATNIERSARNRALAISYHGYKCQACGFDFAKTYGDWGKGYIEVHHVNPLAAQEGSHLVNPRTDLVCLCANCHRMVHRNRNQVLSVEELKQMIG